MNKTIQDLIVISITTLFLTFLIWLPHFLRVPNFYGLNFSEGFNTIYRNFDGIEYVIIAKTFYYPEILKDIPQSLPEEYYAAHFPGYSLLILLFAPLMGFLKSMIFVAIAFTIASAIAFYFLVRDFKLTSNPLLLSIIFLILPARWLIVHSVGSSEPMFIFFVIASLYFFMKFEEKGKLTNIYLSALFGAFAQVTRPPGILLAIALGTYILWKIIKGGNFFKDLTKSITTYYPLLLIPISLLSIFYWFHLAFNDFFAYFHSGDNIHLTFPPYQVFNKDQSWVGEVWLEDIIYIFILSLYGTILLFKKRLNALGFFAATYLSASMLVAHRDIARYVLPIFPFILIAFEKVLVSKEFRLVLIILAVGIYVYAQNFLLANTAPFPNLEAFD